jgi:alpha-tubulin suppressor-like RCC1 family protein
MTEYKTDKKLGVGEILICNKETNGKLESLKVFIGKVIINICGGGEKLYVIEEKERMTSEVKSIQSRSNFHENQGKSKNFNDSLNSANEDYEINQGKSIQPEENNRMMGTFQSNLHDIKELDEANENEHFPIGPQIQTKEVKKTLEDLPSVINNKTNSNKNTTSFKEELGYSQEILQNIKTSNDIQSLKNGVNTQNTNSSGFKKENSIPSHEKEERLAENETKLSQLNSLKTLNANQASNNYINKENEVLPLEVIDKHEEIPILEKQLSPNLSSLSNHLNREIKETGSEFLNEGRTENTLKNIKDTGEFMSVENQSPVIQIEQGKYHLLKLTADGKVYGSGKSYFGVVGLGGYRSADKAVIIPNLANIRIVQIACGKYHSLALSNIGDIYSWGMGFEGQLGLTGPYEVASSPRYLNFFFKKPVKFIACGHNYSLCITKDSQLFGWGENSLGQLGLGKVQFVKRPTKIENFHFRLKNDDCDSSNYADSHNPSSYDSKPLSACYVSAGYAHTAIVTDEGSLLTCGLNIYGQLGHGNTDTSFEPIMIEKDDNGEDLGKVVKVSCNVSGTFIITTEGKLYTCGSGDIGHGEIEVIKLPRLISDGRVYQHVFCNDTSVVAFCPLRILSMSPICGPASGNTILSLIGSAIKDFPKLSVRFKFGGVDRVSFLLNYY